MNIDLTGSSAVGQVNGNKNLDALIMQVMIERAEELDTTVRTIAASIQTANEALKELNDLKLIISTLNKENDVCDISPEQLSLLQGILGDQFGDLFEINSEGKLKARGDHSGPSANSAIDGEISSLNSMSQMTMIELQSSMDKYNNAYSVASNFISKYTSTISTIVSNVR